MSLTKDLDLEQGSLYTLTVPGASSPTAAARLELRTQPGGTVELALTTGGHGIANDGRGNFVATFLPSQTLAVLVQRGVWDIFNDPNGVADDSSTRLMHGTWTLAPAVTDSAPTPQPNPTPAPAVGDTVSWNGSTWVPTPFGYAKVFAGAAGMHDADFTVTQTSGLAHIAATSPFTADRAVVLPGAPDVGMQIDWSDECTAAGGALANHNVIFNGGSLQIMSGGTDQTGGNTLAATYTATKNAWPAGSVVSLRCSLASDGVTKFWKVI